MKGETVIFGFDLGAGEESATAWGCDLTEKYVEINGKYTT
jgi:glutamate N-acetyltransferase/amino-acid N-acetyltransferase